MHEQEQVTRERERERERERKREREREREREGGREGGREGEGGTNERGRECCREGREGRGVSVLAKNPIILELRNPTPHTCVPSNQILRHDNRSLGITQCTHTLYV